MSRPLRNVLPVALAAAAVCLTVSGCATGGNSVSPKGPVGAPGTVLGGRVFGGQQPISGASVYLYAAGSGGYGSAYSHATGSSLLGSHVVTTDGTGTFHITGDYTCPSAATEVYIEAVGGAPVAGSAANPNILMVAALGPCGNLSSTQFITMNELTTVASIWALAPFMAGPSNIGTSSANAVGLSNAFASVNKLVDTAYGAIPGPALPALASIPSNELNTLADILAACVNYPGGGTAGDGSPCGNLFTWATPPGGTAPTDTATAAMNIAKHPAQQVTNLNNLATKTSPFQPILTIAPNAWTIAIRYINSSLSGPAGIAADQAGNVWVTNTTAKSVAKLAPTGALTANYAVGSGPIAIDLGGNAWVAGNTAASLEKISASGTTTAYTGGGLSTTNSIAIDGTGNIWAAGSGNKLSEFSSSGTPVSSSGYTGGGLTNGQSVAITPH